MTPRRAPWTRAGGAAFTALRACHDALLAAAHGASAASVCPLLPLGDTDAELAKAPHWQQ